MILKSIPYYPELNRYTGSVVNTMVYSFFIHKYKESNGKFDSSISEIMNYLNISEIEVRNALADIAFFYPNEIYTKPDKTKLVYILMTSDKTFKAKLNEPLFVNITSIRIMVSSKVENNINEHTENTNYIKYLKENSSMLYETILRKHKDLTDLKVFFEYANSKLNIENFPKDTTKIYHRLNIIANNFKKNQKNNNNQPTFKNRYE